MATHASRSVDSEPIAPAHAATEITGVDGINRLRNTSDVLDRYRRPGPHATVVMAVPMPGAPGDDLGLRWSATRSDLRRLGATDEVLHHLDHAVEHLPRCGYDVLLSADEVDVAYCWLTRPATNSVIRVGAVPTLLPALAEVDHRPGVVAAAVDRIGADLHVVDHAHVEPSKSVDGDDERIHKSAGDGSDQARNQRHSEVIWNRNAQLVADAIGSLAKRRRATAVVLTGDRRATDLVTEHLGRHTGLVVDTVRAGGRHEPQTTARLLAASIEMATRLQDVHAGEGLQRLTEELGQQDLAVDGEVRTLEAVAEGRAKTVFVDVARCAHHVHVDDTVKAAAATGGSIVMVDAPDIADGVAALLRTPYQP
jgi:hypothetical protein